MKKLPKHSLERFISLIDYKQIFILNYVPYIYHIQFNHPHKSGPTANHLAI